MDIDYQEKYEETYWAKILCLIKLSNFEFVLGKMVPYLKLDNHYDLVLYLM
jgi:hypothetical protein